MPNHRLRGPRGRPDSPLASRQRRGILTPLTGRRWGVAAARDGGRGALATKETSDEAHGTFVRCGRRCWRQSGVAWRARVVPVPPSSSVLLILMATIKSLYTHETKQKHVAMNNESKIRPLIDPIVDRLKGKLAANLYSCIVYGSAVRGDLVTDVSDINLLLVLQESTPQAHFAIAEAISGAVRVDPFIIGRRGMERSIRAFGPKFLSIRRDYCVLHGEDFLADLNIDPELERFLTEQALRNQRLRLVHSFMTLRDNPQRYTQYILHARTGVIVQISEALRLAGVEMPHVFSDRLPIIEREMEVDATVLRDLTTLKEHLRRLSAEEITMYHAGLFQLLDRAICWIEEKWPNP